MRIPLTCIVALFLSQPLRAQSSQGEYKHRVAFTPIAGLISYDYGNPAMGFDYEYVFDTEHGIGVHIPFAFGFSVNDDFSSGDYRHTQAYVAPGLLFHTGSKRSRVDFATGPSIMFGNLHFSPRDDYYHQYPVDAFNYGLVAFLVDNSLNFNKEHFQFGFDVRMGPLLEQRDGNRFFIHFGMHFGGRF